VAQRPEALAVLEEFAAGSMGMGCELWNAEWTRKQMPQLNSKILGALSSPHELRVEARDALPALARWLEDRYNVVFAWNTIALAVEGGTVHHATGALDAHAAVVAPGAAIATFAPELARIRDVRHCKLQMMRLASPRFRLPSVVMTDLSLLRYGGFAAQPAARALGAVAQRDCGKLLEHGIHLIVAQGADGSLIVGDSHHYADVADAFSSSEVDELILGELRALFDIKAPDVRERWLGYYPVASVKPVLTAELAPRTRLVSVTSGTGMSTAFAIGEETIASLF
jgi:FAD dependent oxidoreductase TIGR03364